MHVLSLVDSIILAKSNYRSLTIISYKSLTISHTKSLTQMPHYNQRYLLLMNIVTIEITGNPTESK